MSQNPPTTPLTNSESADELYKEAYKLLERAQFLSDPKGSIRNKIADKYCSIIFAIILIFSYPLFLTLAPAPYGEMVHSRPPNTPVKVLRYTPPATSSQRVTPLHDPLAWTCDEEGLFYDEWDQPSTNTQIPQNGPGNNMAGGGGPNQNPHMMQNGNKNGAILGDLAGQKQQSSREIKNKKKE